MDFASDSIVGHRAVAGILGGAVVWWYAAASRRPPRRTHDGIVLEMPLRMASVLSALFIFGVYVWLWGSVVGLGPRLMPMWLLIALVGGYFVRRTVTVRHELHARGLRYATGLTGRKDVHWFDVVEVHHSGFRDTLEIGLRDGTTASISTRMIGFGHLCRALLDRAPTHAQIEPDVRAFLSESAESVAPA